MKTIHTMLALGVTCTLLAGCADTVKPPIQARQDPYQREQVHIASMDLRRHTAVEAPIVSRDDGGLIRVQVPIRAATDKKLYVDYRVTFFSELMGSVYCVYAVEIGIRFHGAAQETWVLLVNRDRISEFINGQVLSDIESHIAKFSS